MLYCNEIVNNSHHQRVIEFNQPIKSGNTFQKLPTLGSSNLNPHIIAQINFTPSLPINFIHNAGSSNNTSTDHHLHKQLLQYLAFTTYVNLNYQIFNDYIVVPQLSPYVGSYNQEHRVNQAMKDEHPYRKQATLR